MTPQTIIEQPVKPITHSLLSAGLPTFIGIGAQRAGTTWLYECLAEHPQVFMSAQKELGYFGAEPDPGIAWYEQQFADRGEAIAVGEITPTYMVSEASIRQMAAVVPEARLIAVLREPVSRAFSAYQLFKSVRWADVSFAQAAQRESDLIRYGLYAQQLEMLYGYFHPAQVKVFLYDDITASASAAVSELFEFIGVDPSYRPASLGERYNRVIFPRTQALLSKLKLGGVVEAIKATPVGPWIKRTHARTGRRAQDAMTPEDRQRIKAHFSDDISKLERLLGRDLSAWR